MTRDKRVLKILDIVWARGVSFGISKPNEEGQYYSDPVTKEALAAIKQEYDVEVGMNDAYKRMERYK